MINKKEFDLLLQEISQIENKIVEIKVLNQFDKANEYEIRLENIREKAKDISLNQDGSSTGFDELSLSVFVDLISWDSDIDYYILEQNNVIESREENIIDAAALKKIKELCKLSKTDLKEMDIKQKEAERIQIELQLLVLDLRNG